MWRLGVVCCILRVVCCLLFSVGGLLRCVVLGVRWLICVVRRIIRLLVDVCCCCVLLFVVFVSGICYMLFVVIGDVC